MPLARGDRRRWFLRDALVAARLAVTVPIMVLAAASIRGAAGSTTGTALGFDPDRVAVVVTNLGMPGYDAERRDCFLRDALDRVQAMPGVESAVMSTRPPAMARRFWPEGTALGQRFSLDDWNAPAVAVAGVSTDYKVQFPTEAPAPDLHLAAS